MFIKNLILSLRVMGRNKLFSILNIIGLSVGLATTILLYLWIVDELSFNRYYENSDRMFLVQHWQHYSSRDFPCPVGPGPLAPELKERYPEVERTTRYNYLQTAMVTHGNKKLTRSVHAADPDYVYIFTCPVVYGSKEDFANDPSSVAITKSISNQLFGDKDPIGEMITLDNEHTFTVKLVVEDFPDNVTYNFNMLVHFQLLAEAWGIDLTQWHGNFTSTIALLKEGVDYKEFEKKAVGFLDEMKENPPEEKNEVFLNPFTKLYLYESDGSGGRIVLVRIFCMVAIFILLLACFNYTNLATARASNRAKEIGIRKVVSASRKNLIFQFLGESYLVTFISLNFALILANLFLPYFNNLAGKELSIHYHDTFLVISVFIFWIVTSFLAGIYPAFVLSSFGTIKSLKNNTVSFSSGNLFRKVLVILQFTFSIALILLTILIVQQVNFMKKKDLGYNKDNLIYTQIKGKVRDRYDIIKNELLQHNDIKNMCRTSHYQPTMVGSNGGGYEWEGKDPETNPLVSYLDVDLDFVETFEIGIVKGRDFSPEFASDTAIFNSNESKIVINETFAEIIDLDNITEKHIYRENSNTGEEHRYPIIGVVEDFHYNPKNRELAPLMMRYDPAQFNYIFIRLTGENIPQTINHIKNIFEKYNPGFTFDYGFMDDRLARDYQNEEKYLKIFKAFAIFAIFISCLGLFGLAAFSAQKRTKEIGIRKALGATSTSIIFKLSTDMTWWILIANLLAWPAAYFVMVSFLKQFPYKVDISIWIFVITGIASLFIAWLTVLYHAYFASVKNPVDSLRYE